MLLGQLYHYLKELDKIELPLRLSDIENLEILSLGDLRSADFIGFDEYQITLKIRDIFSQNYTHILKKDSLHNVANLWEMITSPNQPTQDAFQPHTDYTSKVFTWLKEGARMEVLDTLMIDSKLVTEESDVALYYGLKVLNKLTFVEDVAGEDLELSDKSKSILAELSEDSQILVITKNYLAPLFKNINCQVLPDSLEYSELLKSIEAVLAEHPSIQMIILTSDKDTETEHALNKHFDKLLVTSINLTFETTDGKTYFDHLVRKTLGVRLP